MDAADDRGAIKNRWVRKLCKGRFTSSYPFITLIGVRFLLGGAVRTLLLLCTFFCLLTSLGAQASDQPIHALDWLKGQWETEFQGKQLNFDFTDTAGRTLLSTFKQVNRQNRMVFSRFMSIAQTDQVVKLQLYPNLEKSKDHFVLVPGSDKHTLVFKRVYADADCQLRQGLVRQLVVTDLEQKCDRYPVHIVYTRLSDNQFQENLIGYRQQGELRIKDDIERTYTRVTQ